MSTQNHGCTFQEGKENRNRKKKQGQKQNNLFHTLFAKRVGQERKPYKFTESARSWSPAASASICSSLFNSPASMRMNVVFPVPFSPTQRSSNIRKREKAKGAGGVGVKHDGKPRSDHFIDRPRQKRARFRFAKKNHPNSKWFARKLQYHDFYTKGYWIYAGTVSTLYYRRAHTTTTTTTIITIANHISTQIPSSLSPTT